MNLEELRKLSLSEVLALSEEEWAKVPDPDPRTSTEILGDLVEAGNAFLTAREQPRKVRNFTETMDSILRKRRGD